MFSSLKKLFGQGDSKPESPRAVAPERSPAPSGNLTFLRREPIFDRANRLSGHLFHLRESSLTANAAVEPQRAADQKLLETLCASPDAWDTTPAFIPLSSASLDLAVLEQLGKSGVILLLQLAPDAEAAFLCEVIDRLRERGIRFGVFRQPRNPAFAKVIAQVDFAVIDIGGNEAGSARDFSAAVRASRQARPLQLLACNVETPDDYRFCHQWHYEGFHGKFASLAPENLRADPASDPHKALLLNVLRLVQGDAETAEIAEAIKQDPLLGFRILRYLNSPALGLAHRIDSLSQALIILGRQRLSRWLAVLLFSVREPDFGDWLMVENALTRGRLMEVLGERTLAGQSHDPLFLTGIFSCLDRLLRRPLSDILNDIPVAEPIRQALLGRAGPYAPLLAVAEASESSDAVQLATAAQAAGITADDVNSALLAATAWASEVTEYWE